MLNYDPLLLQFWGKTPKGAAPADQFHPALFHMLDVALVAEALLEHGSPRLRRALGHAWRGCDPAALRAWLPFLVAIHDLGKLSAAFQGQVEAQKLRLTQAGVRFHPHKVELYHAEVSALWLHQELRRREPGVSDELVFVLRDAMGGHHGRFSEAEMTTLRRNLVRSEQSEPRWAGWRDQAYTVLHQALAPDGALAELGPPTALRPATATLTGFIVWADWMGSNEHDFPATTHADLPRYLVEARARAVQALATHQMHFARPAPHYPGFGNLFPDQPQPRPLQTLIEALPIAGLEQPSLTLIEAPTGEGKTEAALALARRIAVANGIDEIFFALPTMATGNQMFLRVQRMYDQLYGRDGAVRLVHGQALAVEPALRRRIELAADTDHYDPDGLSAAVALEWFVGPKKARLAPFGVGTVDQIELAALNVRHYALHLFGLASKVVVIDEVHAYDAYMNTILDHSLSWLASLGCSVILLSATLPRERQRSLAAAYLRGLGVTTPPQLEPALTYPLVSRYTAHQHSIYPCAAFRGEQRVTLRLTPQRNLAAEVDYLLDLVSAGGAVARICNRVDDAQALYAALIERGVAQANRVLLHARFPLQQRQQHEQRIEALVGKATSRTADQALIIVGTQVLEQSLDYDVDVMISDFAPLDLLLQRAGRLHRHARATQRPLRHQTPVLEVTYPQDANGHANWKRWEAIYAPYILWRTLAALSIRLVANQVEVVLPDDYRPLIEAVYGEADHATGPYATQIQQAQTRYSVMLGTHEAKARRPLNPDPTSTDPITYHGGHSFIEDESGEAASWQLAKTRLGDRVTLVPLYRRDGALQLDRHGTIRLSLDTPPTPDELQLILQYAVPVSDRRIIAAYRDERRVRELRWPWPELPALLRGLHPLTLDPTTQSTTLNGCTLHLDPELGLGLGQAAEGSGLIFEEEL